MSVKPYLIIILIISGCSYIPFNKKNIETKEITELIKKSDIYNEDFSQFLITQGFNDDKLPIKNWGLKELIYAQQFFNPELKTAKMKWEMVKTNEVIANLRPASSIGLEIGIISSFNLLSEDEYATTSPVASSVPFTIVSASI